MIEIGDINMAAFDINKYQNTNIVPDKEGSNDDRLHEGEEIKQSSDSDTENTILLMGPLTQIFADALQKVLKRPHIVSTENVQDQISELIRYRAPPSDKKGMVIYVTDRDHLDKDVIGEFDNLRSAMDQKDVSRRYVIAEGFKLGITGKSGIVLKFAREHADRLFYSRDEFLEHLKKD